MIATAKGMVPKKTGETFSGIKKKKRKEGYEVASKVRRKGKTGFMQNFWSNRQAPHRTPRVFWNRDANGKLQKTLYGDGSHRITGTPRWFHFATLRTRKEFLRITRKRLITALKVKV